MKKMKPIPPGCHRIPSLYNIVHPLEAVQKYILFNWIFPNGIEKDFCHRISKDLHIIASLLHNVPTHKGVFNFDAILGITS